MGRHPASPRRWQEHCPISSACLEGWGSSARPLGLLSTCTWIWDKALKMCTDVFVLKCAENDSHMLLC